MGQFPAFVLKVLAVVLRQYSVGSNYSRYFDVANKLQNCKLLQEYNNVFYHLGFESIIILVDVKGVWNAFSVANVPVLLSTNALQRAPQRVVAGAL